MEFYFYALSNHTQIILIFKKKFNEVIKNFASLNLSIAQRLL